MNKTLKINVYIHGAGGKPDPELPPAPYEVESIEIDWDAGTVRLEYPPENGGRSHVDLNQSQVWRITAG